MRDTVRRGVRNEGAFFSPYYLFDLMTRHHRDELDFDGRERERSMLPRTFRAAMARLDPSSTFGPVWRLWYDQLFRALGLDAQNLGREIATEHHGRVPVSHVVIGLGGAPLLLVDLHRLGVDLDRDSYDPADFKVEELTREPISRAFELALDRQEARWGLLSNGTELRLYRKGSTVSRQFLAVDFAALFDADRDDEWTAFWGVFRRQAFVVDAVSDKCFLDRVLEESQRHASRIAEDLRENVVEALEALVQGVLDETENRRIWGGGQPDPAALSRLFEEAIYYLYRLLFILYAESRDILPVGESRTYRDTYSVEHLRDMAERDLRAADGGKTYYAQTLRTLFRMLRQGFRCPEFAIPALGGRGPEDRDWQQIADEAERDESDRHLTSLFDGRRTLWLDRCKLPDRALRAVVRELSLSRPKRRADRRERYSYADLGVDQLGSVYEGLLVYEPMIATEEMFLAKVKGEARLVTRAQVDEGKLEILENWSRAPGRFVLRVWGGRRKGSGSYYTPHEITGFLVRKALEPTVARILEKCAASRPKSLTQILDAVEAPMFHPETRIAEQILDLKVCDPAMGSGAFLIQACRYLADAYGRALIAEGRDRSGRIEQDDLAHFKRLVAERCLYGVDLNPLAVELAKVSLWLETLAKGRPLSFLDSHLRCGNSLVGAPLRDESGRFSADRIAKISSEALELASRDVTPEQKAKAKRLVRENDGFVAALATERARGTTMPLFDLDEGLLRSTLEQYVKSRRELEESDERRTDADALRLREEKEQKFRQVYLFPGSAVQRLKHVCDLWCSAWFWPEEENATPAFGSEEFRQAVAQVLRGDTPNQRWHEVATAIAAEQRFLHWELEFPEVFLPKGGGFDAIVGNPPWEKVSGDPSELAEEYDPVLKTLVGDERDLRVQAVLNDPELGQNVLRKARSRAQYARFGRSSPMFVGLIRGELNTFAPFTVLGWRLHREGGAVALVLKDAFHLTESLAPLRRAILEEGEVHVLATSDNERKVFDAMNRVRFDLLVASRGRRAKAVPISVHRFRTPQEIVAHATQGVMIPLELLYDDEQRPSEPIPEIQDEAWSAAFVKAQRATDGESLVQWSMELHSSGDKSLWTREGRPAGSPGPVLAMVAPFDAFEYEPLAWLLPAARHQPAFSKVGWNHWRVGARKRTNEERALIAGIIPPECATCDFLLTTKAPRDPEGILVCAAVANSLVMDFLIRPFVGSNMQKGILERMPWALQGKERRALAENVLRLLATQKRYDALRDAMGVNSTKIKPPRTGQERAQVRALVEAQVGTLYNLSSNEYARVLAFFRVLDRDQPALDGEAKSFVTRDLALLEFFRLMGERPPTDIVTFFRSVGVDVAGITGSIRGLGDRVDAALELGAVAYVPRRKGQGRSAEPEQPAVERE